MVTEKRIAVVTGANKGLGFETCRQLAKAGVKVILTSRDEMRGKEATATLVSEGLDVDYHRADVTDSGSIHLLESFIRREYEKLDILVNNAGVFLDHGDSKSVFQVGTDIMRGTMETNVYGPLLMIQKFVPLMKEHNYGRIVNVSSGLGQLTEMSGQWAAYRMSKAALNALTRIVAAELGDSSKILVNAVCPGWVRTDMGGPDATRSPEKGAETITWLALLPDDGPSGKLFRDRKEISW